MIYHRPSRLLTVHGAALFAVVAGLCIAPATPACAAEVAGAAIFGTWLETGAQPQAAQQTPPQDTKPTTNPAQQQPKQQPAPKPQQPPQNPFENVPETPQNQPKNPPTNPVTPPNGIQEAKPVVIADNMIEEVQFRGQKKFPRTLYAHSSSPRKVMFMTKMPSTAISSRSGIPGVSTIFELKKKSLPTVESSCASW